MSEKKIVGGIKSTNEFHPRPMTLTLKGKDTYYGTREIWEKLFQQFGLTEGKIVVSAIEFEATDSADTVRAKLTLTRPKSS